MHPADVLISLGNPATYPGLTRLRPVALRPTFSDGLPFRAINLWKRDAKKVPKFRLYVLKRIFGSHLWRKKRGEYIVNIDN